MAYSSKAQQRLASARNYKSSEATLDSDSVKGPSDMGNNGPKQLYGSMGKDKSGSVDLYGKTGSGRASGIAGKMSGDGFYSGPKWKRAMEPGELKPGKDSQKNNTTRMNTKSGEKSAVQKNTGSKPKALKGGG